MQKIMQICASQDDLFALDEEGDVYQYNFNTKRWIRLLRSRDEVTDEATALGVLDGERGSRRSHQG